jgi:hypothetical protein
MLIPHLVAMRRTLNRPQQRQEVGRGQSEGTEKGAERAPYR